MLIFLEDSGGMLLALNTGVCHLIVTLDLFSW